MTLYDLIINADVKQIFHVYVTNIYDQNIEIGFGRRKELLDEDMVPEGVDHLMDAVDTWYVTKDGALVVLLRDIHFKERAEEQYDKRYVETWDNLNPKTRPWKHSSELPK